jgi:hypothetical protein
MNTIKPIYISAFAFLALVGCDKKQQASTSNLVTISAPRVKRRRALTENDLKRGVTSTNAFTGNGRHAFHAHRRVPAARRTARIRNTKTPRTNSATRTH